MIKHCIICGAAFKSPPSAKKVWELIDPSGNHITITNLLDWARNNYALFEPMASDPEKAATRIASGFRAIAGSMRGVKSCSHPASTYKGWSLAGLPTEKGG